MKERNMRNENIAMAATVVLWHKNKIFLIQRHRKSGFMGNAHVFPGGRLDDEDIKIASHLEPYIQSLCLQRCPMLQDPIHATAICWAALRETAEESGIFICKNKNGAWLNIEEQKKVQETLRSGCPFNEIMQTNQWLPAFEVLHPVAWWLTPPVEKKRFNTFFFTLRLTQETIYAPDPRETHGGQWWDLKNIFQNYKDKKIFLAPPTFAVLEDLYAANTFENFVQLNRPKNVICPKVELNENGTLHFLLPGHPNHPETIEKPGVGTRIALQMPQGGNLCSIFMD